MDKVDFRKEYKTLYAPKANVFSMVTVPKLAFLMVDGEGDPNTAPSYVEAVQALYAVAYGLKFASKKELGKDYVVPPLEGLWWAKDMTAFMRRAKDEYRWTMMIMQPDWITPAMVATAVDTAKQKKKLSALELVRFEAYEEGESVQIMHIGTYDEEAPTLIRLHKEYMPGHDLVFNGRHHEIYLGDPRKTDPSKLKTILRQPVKKAPTS